MAGGEFRLGTVATYMSTYISILTISHNPYRKHIHVNHPASTNLGFGVLPPNLDLRYVELRPSPSLLSAACSSISGFGFLACACWTSIVAAYLRIASKRIDPRLLAFARSFALER